MGKASSAKKVARAARAGGRRTGQRRQLGFPVAIIAIVVLGLGLVAFARQSNQDASDGTNPPQPNDHWHASYGIYICDRFLTNVADKGSDALGIHTHEDGLIHIHPFTSSAAGKQAKMGKFFDQVGMSVSDSSIKLPAADPFDGRLYREGDTTCDGKPAQVEVAYWADAVKGANGGKPTKTFTSDLRGIRFTKPSAAYTIAFVPKGTDVRPAPSAAQIETLGQADAGASGGTNGQPIDTGSSVPIDTTPPESTPASDTSGPADGSTTAPAEGSTTDSAPATTAGG